MRESRDNGTTHCSTAAWLGTCVKSRAAGDGDSFRVTFHGFGDARRNFFRRLWRFARDVYLVSPLYDWSERAARDQFVQAVDATY